MLTKAHVPLSVHAQYRGKVQMIRFRDFMHDEEVFPRLLMHKHLVWNVTADILCASFQAVFYFVVVKFSFYHAIALVIDAR